MPATLDVDGGHKGRRILIRGDTLSRVASTQPGSDSLLDILAGLGQRS